MEAYILLQFIELEENCVWQKKTTSWIPSLLVDRIFSCLQADKEYTSEIRRPISSRIGLSSPGYEDRYDWRYNSARSSPCGRSDDGITRYFYDESRSPRYTQQSSRSVGYRRSPAQFEVVDDRLDKIHKNWKQGPEAALKLLTKTSIFLFLRFRDDEYGSRRRSSNTLRLMSEDFKFVGKRSPENLQKNAEKPAIPLEARLERERSWKSSQSAILHDRNVGKDAQGPSKVKVGCFVFFQESASGIWGRNISKIVPTFGLFLDAEGTLST